MISHCGDASYIGPMLSIVQSIRILPVQLNRAAREMVVTSDQANPQLANESCSTTAR